MHDLPQALLVAALGRLDGEPEDRARELDRHQVDMVFVVGVVQHAVVRDLLDLRDRADVTRQATVDRHVLLAAQHIQLADLEGLAAVAHEQLAVARDSALVHAEHAQLAHERIHADFEHVRDHVLGGIGRSGIGHGLRAFALEELRGVAFGRRGQQVLEHVEQLAHAGAGAGGGEADGHQVTLAQRLLERLVQLVRVDVALLEIARHQLLVHLDHLVDEGAMRFGDGGEVRFAAGIEEAVHHLRAAGRGQVDRQAFLAEGFLELLEQGGQVDVVRVDLVDHQQTAQPALARPVHHARGGQLDAGLCVDHDHRRLHRLQAGDGLAMEVGIARGVDHVHARAVVIEVGDCGVQRMLVLLLQRIEVAHGGAALDAAGGGDRAGCMQQVLRPGWSCRCRRGLPAPACVFRLWCPPSVSSHVRTALRV